MKKKYHSDKKLLSVVDQIYAAASGDLGWNKALEGVCDALGAQAADLSAVQVPALAGGASAFSGGGGSYLMDNRAEDAALMPVCTGQPAALLARARGIERSKGSEGDCLPASFSEVCPEARSPAPGLSAWVRRSDDGGPWMVLTVHFQHQDAALSEERREQLGLLLPHIRRAFCMEQRLAHALHSEAELKETLEHVCKAVLLLNAQGQIVHANELALSLLSQQDCIHRVSDQLLRLPDMASQQVLQTALKDCGMPCASSHESRFAPQIIVRGKAGSYVLSVQPLSGAQRLRSGAAAVVLIQLPQASDMHHLQPLRDTYGLTASELHLVHGLVNGRSLKQIASSKGASYETMRVHLRQVFGKTGVNRQALLVNLARSGYP